ncbi:glycosyl transferase family 2 [Thermodesulfatator indicus DSM 15286]|uniref:Glycosyl transferase family 2 n=1 Tax=Thermodesulfatator indicus (strain DSM 15286 / JCM 11887 / CIR29812) TaxID=667014 RepID=F8ABL0_THEID|nr:glycosyltransferase family 2 protein [Thermodesulfatator indicus]AEH45609.1 glycosyl transferase family 2 [Thermodesulfatator indicus DSM 15286]
MPLVSVIIPTYNRAFLLREAIFSVINQTFQDWELLIIDDRSTDNTKEIVSDLARKEPRIKYLTNKFKKGPAGARKYGIQNARGEYIAFLDSDDLWKPWHLEKAIFLLTKYKYIDWFYADVELVKNNNVIISSIKKKNWHGRTKFSYLELEPNFFLFNDQEFLYKAIKYEIYAGLQTSVIKKSTFNFVNFNEDVRIGEDKLLVYEAILSGLKFAYLLNIHATYRVHENHLSNVYSQDLFSQEKKILEYTKHYKILLERLPASRKRERSLVIKKLSQIYFWDIGYSLFWQNLNTDKAFYYFKKALKIYPFNLLLWKTYFFCLVKKLFLSKHNENSPD